MAAAGKLGYGTGGKMIVSEKDSTWIKIKWYIVCFTGSIIILVLLGGVLPFLVIKYCNTIIGGILFLPCFWVAGKLCFMLENYIGIGCSLQNPNRHNLVRVFPDEWTLPWMRPAEMEKKNKIQGSDILREGK